MQKDLFAPYIYIWQREHLGILEGKKAGELLAWDDYKRMHFTNSVRLTCKIQDFDGCIETLLIRV